MEKFDVKQIVLSENNFSSFNEMQKKALDKNLFEKNMVVSAPTAAGKTIIMELCALDSILNKKQKIIYTCPLRALANEHFSDFRKKYSKKYGIRAALSIGDIDSSSSYLQNYDFIATTFEKLESLLRHKAGWLSSVGALVVDEVHELDSDRGPTLEMVVTKMRFVNPLIKVVALSATIPNSVQIAKWLGAELVESNFRPVKLVEGVYFAGSFEFGSGSEKIAHKKDSLVSVALDTLEKQKQLLVFANTRKRAEDYAKKLSSFTEAFLSQKEKTVLSKDSQKILHALESPTEQCKSLSFLAKSGVAFHHAGLLQKQREVVEELFRENAIKIVCATTTLGAGINMPAYRVAIPSLYRYTEYGNQKIPVREYKQLSGRAGRPKYHDSEGQSMVFANSELEMDEVFQNYVNGKIEEVSSKLGIQSVLRMHLLGLIASDFVFDLKSMEDFFSKTFYFHQFGSDLVFFRKISGLTQELKEMGFIEANEKGFHVTPIGRRVSELYLDPLSASKIIESLKKNIFHEMTYLFTIANTSEMYPFFSVPKKIEQEVWEQVDEQKNLLPVRAEIEMYSDPHFLKKFATSLVLKEWVNEKPEDKISRDFGVQPGILHSKKQIAEWIAYSCFELSKLLDLKEHFAPLSKLQKRLHHGVKEELVHLTELRGIGRVRARRLYNADIRTITDVKKTDIQDLQKIIPQKAAQKVKEQVTPSFEPVKPLYTAHN